MPTNVKTFTALRHKEPAPAALGPTSIEDEERRDQTIETEWFPIFREGSYPQGEYTASDVDEIAEEFAMTLRRSPIVFDHLNEEDLEPGAKPGAAVGYVIELRTSDDETPQYKGKRILEARAKVSFWGSYMTRSGEFRSCSVGLYHHKSHTDQKERLALHHLALLGAQTPGVEGLPEIIFSGTTPQSKVKNVSFPLGTEFRISKHSAQEVQDHQNPREPRVDTINFSEHKAILARTESELKLAHQTEIQTFKDQVTSLNGQITKFQEELDETKAALEQANAAAATAAAELPAKIEAAKQEGIAEGAAAEKTRSERYFAEEKEKSEIVAFCEELRTSGQINEVELKGDGGARKPLAETILSIPAGDAREQFKGMLKARPAIAGKQPVKPAALFSAPKPVVDHQDGSPEAQEQADTIAAQDLVREGKFSNFRAAYAHIITHRQEA